MVPLPAGRSAILFHRARRLLGERPDSYMMPNALKLPESITENAAEAMRTVHAGVLPDFGTLVISVSSGTVAAGVLRGFRDAGVLQDYRVILHHGYSRSVEATRKYIERVAGLSLNNLVEHVDEGYSYKAEARNVDCPFPCNPHYDLKAWKWLRENTARFSDSPVILWNIGS
jgi:hypothetical protein